MLAVHLSSHSLVSTTKRTEMMRRSRGQLTTVPTSPPLTLTGEGFVESDRVRQRTNTGIQSKPQSSTMPSPIRSSPCVIPLPPRSGVDPRKARVLGNHDSKRMLFGKSTSDRGGGGRLGALLSLSSSLFSAGKGDLRYRDGRGFGYMKRAPVFPVEQGELHKSVGSSRFPVGGRFW